MFFQWECWFFWPQAFCKTVLCRFFIWIYRVFKTRIVFSMIVFVFCCQGFCKTALCRFFHMNLLVFLSPELFFQWEFLFFGFRHFVRRCFAVFSFELGISLSSEHFKNWKKHIHRILKNIQRIYFSNSGRYFLGKTNSAITSSEKCNAYLKKSIFQYFLNSKLNRKKSIPQNQDFAKSWKNNFSLLSN